MKPNAIILFIGLFPSFLWGQSVVYGTVMDEKGAPVEFANTILLLAKDSSMVKTSLSDADGKYSFDYINEDAYFVEIRQVGYSSVRTKVFEVKGGISIAVPEVRLSAGVDELQALEVVYVKPLVEVKADKTIFNVEGTTNAMGLNALELLRKAPGVVVDNNENIMVKGRGGIVVYIDGKLSPLDGDGLKDYLKNLQSANIESIEIITNPSSKYDAAGNAGIINIKLKKNKNFGTNGNVSAGWATQRYSKYNTNLSLNHRNAKINAYMNYGNNWGYNWNYMDFFRVQNGISFDQFTNNRSAGLNHNYKAGVDFFVHPKHTLGVMVTGNNGANEWMSTARSVITDVDPSLDRILVARGENIGRRDNINANLNYHYSDTLGHDLNVDLDYGYFDIYNDSYQPNRYYNSAENFILYENNFRNNTGTGINLYTVKADYEQNLGKGRLGAGFKSSIVETNNRLDFFNVVDGKDFVDSLRTNKFGYFENINALYVNYKREFGSWSIQAGVRAEHTRSIGDLDALTDQSYDQIDRNYINFFPSGGLTYAVNQKNSLSLTYSRRIDRPSYQDLNPFEYRIDELSYRKGNVNLRPQMTHSIEFGHTWMYMVNTSLSYGRTEDFFTEITDTTEVLRSFIIPRNLGFQEYFAMNVGSPLPIKKWWNGYLNLSFTHLYNRADFGANKTIDLRANNYNIYMMHTFTLNKTTSAEISGWYSGPGIWGGTFVNEPMWSMDLGAKKSFLNDKFIVRVAYADIFWTSRWRGVSDFAGLYMDARGGWESRQFRVNLSYSFGNQDLKTRERKAGSEDLNRRVK